MMFEAKLNNERIVYQHLFLSCDQVFEGFKDLAPGRQVLFINKLIEQIYNNSDYYKNILNSDWFNSTAFDWNISKQRLMKMLDITAEPLLISMYNQFNQIDYDSISSVYNTYKDIIKKEPYLAMNIDTYKILSEDNPTTMSNYIVLIDSKLLTGYIEMR